MKFVRQYIDGLPRVLVVASGDRRGEVVDALDGLDDYAAETVASVDEALAALDDSVSCVVSTQSLPGGRGSELAADLSADYPELPVVLCPETADDAVVRSTARGVDAVVLPTDMDRLAEVVREAAESYLTGRENELKTDAFETLFRTTDDTVLIKDDSARHLFLTTGHAGPDPDEALGKTDIELHDDRFDLGEQWYADDLAVLDGEEPMLQDVSEYGDGEVSFYLEETKLPWHDDDGEVRGLVGHSRNVSELVDRRQRLERKNERLDQFTSYVTHDLRTPLQVAAGYLDLAREGNEEALEKVEDALDRMEDLIHDFGMLADGERARKDDARPVAFVPTAETIWGVIGTDEATLELDVPREATVTAYESDFRPFLENLLKNAVEHGSTSPRSSSSREDAVVHGGDDVTVRVGLTNTGFYVADDGPGIPPEEREAIFDQGYTTRDSGTGTGLAIVEAAADTHDWAVTVTESRDGGARFEFSNCLLVPDPVDRGDGTGSLELAESADIGGPQRSGSSSYDAETDQWTVKGAGADVYGDENEFHFVYALADGPVRIEGRVADVEDINEFSKAGLMIRSSLAEHTPQGYVGRTPRAGTEFLWCDGEGEETTSQQLEADVDYERFRVDRDGDRITCWVSRDGEEWHQADQRSVPLTDPVHVGLAVSSVIPRTLCTAVFEDVRVTTYEESAHDDT